MVSPLALSGLTSCRNWLRRPRLKSAVQSVAVLTVLSLARVAGSSLVMGSLLSVCLGGRPPVAQEGRTCRRAVLRKSSVAVLKYTGIGPEAVVDGVSTGAVI